jgi:hypothetical protein
MYTLAIRTDCYRPNNNIPWTPDAIKMSTDPALAAVKESYLQLERATMDLSNGWRQFGYSNPNSNHCYYLDTFGPDVTEESIMHVYYMYRERYIREFAGPWAQWVVQYRAQTGITTRLSIVQISNPNSGSKCSDLFS